MSNIVAADFTFTDVYDIVGRKHAETHTANFLLLSQPPHELTQLQYFCHKLSWETGWEKKKRYLGLIRNAVKEQAQNDLETKDTLRTTAQLLETTKVKKWRE